jgi:polyisoprenoid-binding protein YceI
LRDFLIILAAACVALPARAEPLVISREAGDTHVVFESKAPMETFQGRTDQVRGTIDLGSGGDGAIALHVVVDMASLDTGIALRNRHMCENHLHTDEHPEAVFHGAKVVEGDAAALASPGDHAVTLEGDFTLHGVTRTIRVPATLARTAGEEGPRLRLTSEFEVALADYGIPRPRMLMLKLNEVQKVSVELWAAPAAAGAGSGPGT